MQPQQGQPQGYQHYNPWQNGQPPPQQGQQQGQPQMQPSSSFGNEGPQAPGFKNIEPRTREEREAGRNKDMLEKQRLRSRYNGAVKYDPPPNPLQPMPGTAMYQDEYQRFERDSSQAEFAARQQKQRQQEDGFARKREEQYQRDKSRWTAAEDVVQRQEQRYQQARQQGTGAKSNISGEAFNIVSLNYADGANGQQLKAKDDESRYKAQVRAATLYGHSHSVPHNIITGEPLRQLPPPQQTVQVQQGPTAPWDR